MFARLQKKVAEKLVSHLGVKGAAAAVTTGLCITGMGIGLYNDRKKSKENTQNNVKFIENFPEYQSPIFKT